LRAKLGLPENYFLASSRFVEKKNLPQLLIAFAAYKQSVQVNTWPLVLLGDGPLRAQLEDQIRQLNLTHYVILPGFKQYQELPAYYGLARAFVHASTSEQWGLVVNEAMASGLPVLVSARCGCALDLVVNGRNGFTFDPGNVEEISQLMLRISGGGCDLVSMGMASREIIADWSPEKFAAGLTRAVDAALSQPRHEASLVQRSTVELLTRF
jgi:glycosyltransferase involved in cell wall biosynthesis